MEIERQWTSPSRDPRPALDPGEQALDPRPVAADAVAVALVLVDDRVAGSIEHPGAASVLAMHRHQVLGAGQHEHVRLVGVVVARQAFVGLAADLGQARATSRSRTGRCPHPSRSSSDSCGPKPDRPGLVAIGTRQRAGAGDRVGGELLADAADRAAALGQADRGRTNRPVIP